jgi:nitrogen fixation NifU-like protein
MGALFWAMTEYLSELYQEILLDHHKRPRNFHALDGTTHQADGHNPLCGDEVTVFLRVEAGTLAEVTFQGQGCAISRASASILTERLRGKTREEAQAMGAEVLRLLRESDGTFDLERDGDLAALSGVRQYPARIKCATLPWHAALNALAGKGKATTE